MADLVVDHALEADIADAAVLDAASAAPGGIGVGVAGRGRGTALLAAGVVLVTVVGLLAPNPVCLLAGAVGAVVMLLRRWLPSDAALPLAAVVLVVVAVLAGLGADLLDVDLLHVPLAGMVVAGSLIAAAVIVGVRGRAASQPLPVRRGLFLLAQAPAAIAAVVAVVQQFDVGHVAAWMFFGTDFAEHALLLAGLQDAGMLDYGAEAYPRGAHALLALVSVAGLPELGTGALLSYDLRLLGAATWLGFGLLLWTMAAVVLRTGAALGLSEYWRVGAALALGVLAFYDAVLAIVFVVMASFPGLMAAVALSLVPLTALVPELRARRLWLLGTTALAVVALAHLWPALLPVPLLACGSAVLRRGVLRDAIGSMKSVGRRPALLGACVALLVVAAVAAAVPVLALLRGTGFATAGVEGGIPAPHLVYTALGLVGVGVLSWWHRSVLALAGGVLGALVAIGVLLWGAGGGLDIEQYYPRKAIWFLGVMVFPLATVLAAVALRGFCVLAGKPLRRLGPAADVARVAGGAVLAAGFVAYGLPLIVVGGSLAEVAVKAPATSDQRKIDIAMQHGHEFTPAVTVPIGLGLRNIPRQSDTYILSKLLRLKTGQPQTFGHPDKACIALREVAGDAPAVVLTDLDVDVMQEMMRRQGCAGPRVVQVPGVHGGVLWMFRDRLGRAAD